ncbi:hypothetical protein C8R44DRAFT_750276 [Mycena epipterygia]|nr:hypothetical protein C8R44DRAFT_750276 [Mycena epipterygia]
MILTLPIELLHKIVAQVCLYIVDLTSAQHWLQFHDTQASWAPPLLRAVCKLLNDAVAPVFFAATPMRTSIRDFEARHAHHELVSRFLPPALEAMRDTLRTVVRSCRWCDLSGAPSAFRAILIDFLDSLTILDNFQLHNGDGRAVDVSLTRLSGLRTLKVTPPRSPTAPRAAHLARSYSQPPALDAASARRRRLRAHLQHPAQGTDLGHGPHRDGQRRRPAPRIPRVVHRPPTPDAGVPQRRELAHARGRRVHGPLLRSVLVQHAASLRLLRCASSAAGRWSFGAHNVEAIVKLQALEELEMCATMRPPTPLCVPPLSLCSLEFDLWIYGCIQELFIDVAAKLPVLRTVSLVPNKRSSSSVAFMHHAHSDKARAKGKIDSVLAKYGQTVDSVAVARWMETRRGYDAGLKPEVGGVAAAWCRSQPGAPKQVFRPKNVKCRRKIIVVTERDMK